MATTLEELVFKFEADMKGLQDGLKSVERQIENTGKKVEKTAAGIGKSLGRIVSFGAIVAAGGALLRYSGQIEKAADALDSAAKAANVSTDALQTYRFAADQAGSSSEAMDLALKNLNKSIGEARAGSKEDLNIFKALGLEDLIQKGASTEAIVRGLADALRQVKDPAQAAAVASRLLGINSAELVDLFRSGAGIFDQYGQKLDDIGGRIAPEVVKANADMADSTARLYATANKFFNDLDFWFNAGIAGVVEWAKISVDYIDQVAKAFEESGLMGAFVGEGGKPAPAPPPPDVNKFGLGPLGAGVAPRQKKIGDLSNLLNPGGADKLAQEAKRYADAVADLNFEMEQLGRSAAEAAYQEELRGRLNSAGVELDSARGKVIAELTAQYVSLRTAQEELAASWEVEAANANRAIKEMHDEMYAAAQEWQEFTGSAGDAVASAFADAIIQGEELSDVIGNLLKQLAELIFQKLVFDQISNAVSSGISGVVGGFAAGGTLNPGNVYQVHRDEVIVPRVPASVIPRSQMGGGGVVLNSVFNVAPGVNKAELMVALGEHSRQMRREIVPIVVAARRGWKGGTKAAFA